jgi:hypothetical protein
MDASDVGITDDMSESELVVCEGEILSRAEQFETSQGWIPQVTLMSPVGDTDLKDVLDGCTVSFDEVHDAINSLNSQAAKLYQPLYSWLYHTFPEIQENLTNAASWYDQADQEAASAMNGTT